MALAQPAVPSPSTLDWLPYNPNPVIVAPGGIVNRGPGCTQPAANCQQLVATNQGSLSSDRAENGGGNGFYTQDDVTFGAAGTLTSICFWGQYQTSALGGGGTEPAVANEGFDITMYADMGGAPSDGVALTVLYSMRVDTTNGLVRGPANGSVPGYVWTVTLPPDPLRPTGLDVAAGECRWLQINGASFDIDGVTPWPFGSRWRWHTDSAAATSPNRDRVLIQFGHNDPAGSTDTLIDDYLATAAFRVNGFDTAWCFSLATAPNACILPPLPNARCSTAESIAVGGAVTGVGTARGLLLPTPFCGANPVNAPTLWYVVNSATTQTLTAGTCGTQAQTTFDTVLNVYCGTCTGDDHSGLNCVANNDTGPGTPGQPGACDQGTDADAGDPSLVTWVAEAGVNYYIAVYGFQLATGTFQLSVTGAGDTPTVVPCASDQCEIPADLSLTPDMGGAVVTETDPCGANLSTNSACDGAGVMTFNLGDVLSGLSDNVGTLRDFDFWSLNGLVPDTNGDGTTWYTVQFINEFPAITNLFGGSCNPGVDNGTFLGGALLPYCANDNILDVQVTAGGGFRINILPVDFGGVPCDSGDNSYQIKVTLATVGACCVPGAGACFLSVEGACVDVTVGGAYQGDNTTCTPNRCPGACCAADGTCSVLSSADCATAGGTYQGDLSVCAQVICPQPEACCDTAGNCTFVLAAACAGSAQGAGTSCTPNPCPQPNGACCCGSSCVITSPAACSGANRTFGGSGSACTPFSFTAPCCRGNYNKSAPGPGAPGGISVQDIFDFLTGYFSTDACANTNDSAPGPGAPNGVSVQDIFDFLAAYFGGC
ncbi:MAG: hypothetical protein IT438_11935 [Phycisphaerales bacterium]|nr:hypothetical protein [Phycisphaerales bacterium]